jgi:hypothetical protein
MVGLIVLQTAGYYSDIETKGSKEVIWCEVTNSWWLSVVTALNFLSIYEVLSGGYGE